MDQWSTDIAIVGAGIAGATLAAALAPHAKVMLIEAEAHPGYHSTGRSAAFWSESYGGPAVQPLTTASYAGLAPYLSPRSCLHIADADGEAALTALGDAFAGRAPAFRAIDRAELEARIPGLAPHYTRALEERSCEDIDVARYHADALADARRAGTTVITDAQVFEILRSGGAWTIRTTAGDVRARLIVDAAGAWASEIAALAGAAPIAITPHRRTIVQLRTDPAPSADMPLVMDAAERFYFKPEAGGRLWLSPHDESPVAAHDVAAEELDVAIAIDRLEHAVDWRIVRRERSWAGLRSFAPDRAPVYGFDDRVPGFFWFAGQGGFGIQTAPAAAAIGAALLLGKAADPFAANIDPEHYSPRRFSR
ncbi:FAD-dependent oxidoreductase [Sphingomonas sp. BIUV-7]|uniref:FAD-dependent oxidoreductase n=1 Tax=Sphingomonas natans TaxID=3063330 RepID=A0ABT8Y4C3_9SPHN|nr:FAD-dependent oxidoreductase [Sphingomonas sp. BIUV-7]MDO6413167.1 FAD-dependent oxidoreductase [Sphingomonas sp. BIUV-7]